MDAEKKQGPLRRSPWQLKKDWRNQEGSTKRNQGLEIKRGCGTSLKTERNPRKPLRRRSHKTWRNYHGDISQTWASHLDGWTQQARAVADFEIPSEKKTLKQIWLRILSCCFVAARKKVLIRIVVVRLVPGITRPWLKGLMKRRCRAAGAAIAAEGERWCCDGGVLWWCESHGTGFCCCCGSGGCETELAADGLSL